MGGSLVYWPREGGGGGGGGGGFEEEFIDELEVIDLLFLRGNFTWSRGLRS